MSDVARKSAVFLSALLAVFVSACAARPLEIGREPELTPVGSGLSRSGKEEAEMAESRLLPKRATAPTSTGSLWTDRSADLFKDARARRVGDILTIAISMKDKASLDNSSKRSRDSSHGFGMDISHAIDWRGYSSTASAKADFSVKSNTAQDGKGAIARSENIDLKVAAVVTEVLPNGNLLIQGTQELRVNFEIRVLTFSGIVNVTDIRSDNTVAYDRIAEARMSYGGRGRITEVQQPAWGHQIVDFLFPF